jgi:hypothetical protein
VEGTAGFYAAALRDIREGEELTFHYGTDYFEDLAGCPCSAHEEARSPYLVSGFFFRKSSQGFTFPSFPFALTIESLSFLAKIFLLTNLMS